MTPKPWGERMIKSPTGTPFSQYFHDAPESGDIKIRR